MGYRKIRAEGGELNRKGEPVKPKATIDVLDDPGAIERVLDAYRTAGSYLGAARALTAAGEPIPFGKRIRADGEPYGNGRFASAIWRATTVRRIVKREAPDLAPRIPGVSRKHRPRLFMKLLRCYCGQTMTPGGDVSAGGYWCTRGQRDPDHGKPYSISESRILPWIKAQAARLRVPDELAEVLVDADGATYDDGPQRAALEAMRGIVADSTIAAAFADLDAERERHGERARRLVEVPPALDWTWSTEAVNAWLRAAFEYVQLGSDLLPVDAKPLVPEWWP